MKSALPRIRPLRYHLRFQVLPGPRLAADTRDLVKHCQRFGIEEVVLFFAAEDWNNGLLSRADEERWFTAIAAARKILARAGITTSLNPWMTCQHCDRGRTFPPDRQFTPTVSPAGEVSKACASFADPNFQEYLAGLYARFASLGFRVIWVEDDFRFHNHGPLTWGGGFEQPVLDRFAAKIGRAVTREELVAALLRPGAPHPWRAQWFATWRELHLEVAAKLTAAVAAASGGTTRIGLMTSGVEMHSVEGRRWDEFFAAFSINGRVAHRPHFAPYAEAPGHAKIWSIQMLDLQRNFRPAGCEVAPEVENFPFTNWVKSDTQTWAEMALCQIFGSDALLLDLFPFSANPASREPQIWKMLKCARPGLAWLAANFAADLQTCGVGIPYRTDAASHIRFTQQQHSLYAFNQASPFDAGRYCLQYGIPVAMRPQQVNAIFGPLAWAFDDTEIRKLLRGGLLLDATAAAILVERGFGRQIGLDSVELFGREEETYAVEEVVDDAGGVAAGFYINVNCATAMARLKPARNTTVWTRILRADGSTFGPGWVLSANRLGGRIAVHAAPNPAQLAPCYQRRDMAQALIRFLAGGRFASPMANGGPNQFLIHLSNGSRQCVALLNGGTDPAPAAFTWPGRQPTLSWTRLAPLAPPKPWQRGQTIPYLGILAGTPRSVR